MAYQASTPVRITKGNFKGCTGKIAACNSEGFYFVSGDWDSRKAGQTAVVGPFLQDEIELLDLA
jgi:hypothetical protein